MLHPQAQRFRRKKKLGLKETGWCFCSRRALSTSLFLVIAFLYYKILLIELPGIDNIDVKILGNAVSLNFVGVPPEPTPPPTPPPPEKIVLVVFNLSGRKITKYGNVSRHLTIVNVFRNGTMFHFLNSEADVFMGTPNWHDAKVDVMLNGVTGSVVLFRKGYKYSSRCETPQVRNLSCGHWVEYLGIRGDRMNFTIKSRFTRVDWLQHFSELDSRYNFDLRILKPERDLKDGKCEAVYMLRFIAENYNKIPDDRKVFFVHDHLQSWHYGPVALDVMITRILQSHYFRSNQYGAIYPCDFWADRYANTPHGKHLSTKIKCNKQRITDFWNHRYRGTRIQKLLYTQSEDFFQRYTYKSAMSIWMNWGLVKNFDPNFYKAVEKNTLDILESKSCFHEQRRATMEGEWHILFNGIAPMPRANDICDMQRDFKWNGISRQILRNITTQYIMGSIGMYDCPAGSNKITTADQCDAAARSFSISANHEEFYPSDPHSVCFHCPDCESHDVMLNRIHLGDHQARLLCVKSSNSNINLFWKTCDYVRERCCWYSEKYSVKPFVSWGSTPGDKRKWYTENKCDKKMGGKLMRQCPYQCEENKNVSKSEILGGTKSKIIHVTPDTTSQSGPQEKKEDITLFIRDAPSGYTCSKGKGESNLIETTNDQTMATCHSQCESNSACVAFEVSHEMSNSCRLFLNGFSSVARDTHVFCERVQTNQASGESEISYVGCFENFAGDRIVGHIDDYTIERCEARSTGGFFGMEWPQGSANAGEAQCLSLQALPDMKQSLDVECEAEFDTSGRRLGGGHRLAVYRVPSTSTVSNGDATTRDPTVSPTLQPTVFPTLAPTLSPTMTPTRNPIRDLTANSLNSENCHADLPEATCWPPDSVEIDCELMWSKIKKCEYVETSHTDNAMNRLFQNLDVVLHMFPQRTHGCVFHCLIKKAKELFEKSSTLGCKADVMLVRNNNPDGVGRSVSTIVRNIFEATLEDRTFSFHYWQHDMVWIWNKNLFRSCNATANFNTLKENSWTWPEKVHSAEHIFWPFLHNFYKSIFEYSDPDILNVFRETYNYLPKVSKDGSFFTDSMVSLIHIRRDGKDKENLLTKSQQYADVWFNEFGSGDGKVLFIILTDDETAQGDFTGRLKQLGMDENRISKFAENDYFTKRSLNAQGKHFMHRIQSKLFLARVVDNVICTGTSHFCHTLWALRMPDTPIISMDTKEGMLCGTDCFLGDAEPKEYTYWPAGVGSKPILRNVRVKKGASSGKQLGNESPESVVELTKRPKRIYRSGHTKRKNQGNHRRKIRKKTKTFQRVKSLVEQNRK